MREQVGRAGLLGTSQAGLDESRLPSELGSQGTRVGGSRSSAGDPGAVSKLSHHELGRREGWVGPICTPDKDRCLAQGLLSQRGHASAIF